jgi:pimeloyl-ACP methyl ester carboxylesterase
MTVQDRCEEQVRFIRVDGRRFRAKTIIHRGRDFGKEPALVFLHEGLGCIEMWRDIPRTLADAAGLPALVYDWYDRNGTEPENRSDGCFVREAEVDLPAVLQECGIERPILIGHSDGGTIALLYAARYPERTAGLITLAAHVFTEEVTLAGIRQAVEAFEHGNLRQRLARYHGDRVDFVFRSWSTTWMSPEHRTWDITPLLRSITAPLLAIQGENDEYGTIAQVEAIRAGVSGPTEVVLIPGCGHSPHLQARERTVEEMARFIARLAG